MLGPSFAPTEKRIGPFAFDPEVCISRGAFSRVHRGRECQSGRGVAVKVIRKADIRDQQTYINVKSEIELSGQLIHPNIIRSLAVLQTQNNIYLITELCQSGTLADLIKRGPLADRDLLSLLEGLLSALIYLTRRNLMHRDIKPQNILLCESPTGVVPKLIDFGFATVMPYGHKTVFKECMGSPLYMSPQILAQHPYTLKSDVWALGVTLFQMANGRAPWCAESKAQLLTKIKRQPVRIRAGLPPLLDQVIRGCLKIEESERLSFEQLNQMLQQTILQQCSPLFSCSLLPALSQSGSSTVLSGQIPEWRPTKAKKVPPISHN